MKHAILVVIIFDKPAEDILLYILCTCHLHLVFIIILVSITGVLLYNFYMQNVM